MKQTMRGRLTRFLIASALVSGLTALLLTNFALYRTFYNYKEEVQLKNADTFAEYTARTFLVQKGWTNEALAMLILYPEADQFGLRVYNLQDTLILNNPIRAEQLTMHEAMMRRMGRNSIFFQTKIKNGTHVYREIQINGQKVGSIELIYPSSFSVETAELDFTSNINRSLLLSLAVALGLSALLSRYLSNILSKPIVKLTEVTKSIRSGKLSERAENGQSVLELYELSGAINQLAETLSHQSDIRKRLTSDLAHELRTPLTIIQGQLDAILEGIFEATPERLLVARSETQRLIGLVERLREVADLEDDTVILNYGDLDLSVLANDTVMLFEADALMCELTLESDFEVPIPMTADASRLRQVMVNLISNAIKFTQKNGTVTVKTFTTGSEAVFEVSDTGPGISLEDQPYLFDRFYRADVSRHRETGGNGIGLTIVKLIVDAHHGRIEIESIPGSGASFKIFLPRHPVSS